MPDMMLSMILTVFSAGAEGTYTYIFFKNVSINEMNIVN